MGVRVGGGRGLVVRKGGKSVFSFFLGRLVLEIHACLKNTTFYFYKILISVVDFLQCTP